MASKIKSVRCTGDLTDVPDHCVVCVSVMYVLDTCQFLYFLSLAFPSFGITCGFGVLHLTHHCIVQDLWLTRHCEQLARVRTSLEIQRLVKTPSSGEKKKNIYTLILWILLYWFYYRYPQKYFCAMYNVLSNSIQFTNGIKTSKTSMCQHYTTAKDYTMPI